MKLLLHHGLPYVKSEKGVVSTAHQSMALVREGKTKLQLRSFIQLWHRKVNFCLCYASEQIMLIKCLHSNLITQCNKFAFYTNTVRPVWNRRLGRQTLMSNS